MTDDTPKRTDDVLILFATCSAEQAEPIARAMVTERVVACVNAIPGVVSHYVWEGRVERDEEVVLLMETSRARVDEAVERLRALHDYDVPKIVVIDPEDVSPDYAAWLRESLARP